VDLEDQGEDGVDGVHEFLVSHTGDSIHFGLGGTVIEADAPSTLAGAYEGVVLRLFRREGNLRDKVDVAENGAVGVNEDLIAVVRNFSAILSLTVENDRGRAKGGSLEASLTSFTAFAALAAPAAVQISAAGRGRGRARGYLASGDRSATTRAVRSRRGPSSPDSVKMLLADGAETGGESIESLHDFGIGSFES
jgi:hypothetical protein